MKRTLKVFIVSVCLCLLTGIVYAQSENEFPPAQLDNEEGGAVRLSGELNYTNPFFTSGVSAPLIILEDQAGFIDRDRGFIFPLESQMLGQITSDFYTSPFSYQLNLPIEPNGTLRDVDNDEQSDTGVMVFAVAYWHNVWGDPYLEIRDQNGGGWSGAYASTLTSTDPEQRREIVGGKFLIFAPDASQGFPSDFGTDGLLFTEDDPIVTVPQGYAIVDMNTSPFTFDRSREPTVNLLEPDSAALVDFSDLSYSQAFDAMLEKFRTDYAFTEFKNINWDALGEEFRPLFVQAEQTNNSYAYLTALRQFIWRIPDGHVNISPFDPFLEEFSASIARGIGMGIRETDDQRTLVTFLLPDGTAQRAGIEIGAEIQAINGTPIFDYISQTQPWTQPFSTPHNLRLEQLLYALRFHEDTDIVNVTFRNPDQQGFTTRSIATSSEFETLFRDPLNGTQPDGFELPVEFGIVGNNIGYVAIYSFLDDDTLAIQLWERMIREMRNAGIESLIVDMRENSGGDPFLVQDFASEVE